MVSNHSYYEDKEVSNFEYNNKLSYDKLQNSFLKLHVECLTIHKTCKANNFIHIK